jgi:large subunit ribosomal protein L18
MIKKSRVERRSDIKRRVRLKIQGTTERPRLTVYRSLHHVYAQLVDDSIGKTLVSTSTLSKDLQEELKGMKARRDIAKAVGKHVAKMAVAKNVKRVVFDRNGYLYHGIVKALADGAREAGLEF